MDSYKTTLAIIAVILTLLGYIPYTRDIIKGKNKPHMFSWLLWGFVGLIIFALQIVGGAGVGAYVTLTAVFMCFIVIFLGFKYKNTSDITLSDIIFIILALISLGLWLIAKQPVLSVILTTLIDLFGFAPTIRKSWHRPHTETLSFYYLNTLRFGLAAVALNTFTLVTALYPVIWAIANGLFACMLIMRRKQIK